MNLHDRNISHRNIHAGNILMNHNPEIKLLFAATIYTSTEEQILQSSSSFLPPAAISEWAAPPDIYPKADRYSYACDMWMVGITALELAYGGLKVSSREELMSLVKKFKKDSKKYLGIEKLKRSSDRECLFSQDLQKIVAGCLKRNPRKRLKASKILVSDVFTLMESNVNEFYTHVINEPVKVEVV
ncbi:serine/threonine-protein kinase BLUS1-like [Andrographis paniculata]|uniref:serine/threonine-protein kinase BLUS1-like n=1 Tax=Andrographis paniculata TaxID=175694 RepID=UPI0021E97019|nr:serine/threonine-protein kinase BLUS1-like [Andrographis paniculata]